MDEFKVVRQQLPQLRFEAKVKALVAEYPEADRYTKAMYDDRKRWAESVFQYGKRCGQAANRRGAPAPRHKETYRCCSDSRQTATPGTTQPRAAPSTEAKTGRVAVVPFNGCNMDVVRRTATFMTDIRILSIFAARTA